MFDFFKKRKTVNENAGTANADYGKLLVDMHSHVLPGIDDGAGTIEDSLNLIAHLRRMGIRKIIATPHIMADYYRNTYETINAALNLLKTAIDKENIDIIIEAAAEHYLDEAFELLLTNKKLMTMGDNYVLFELPFISKPVNLIEMIVKMKKSSYKPILAHPERYLYFKLTDYNAIRDYGCLFQVNTISFTGYYGKDVRENAELLADNHCIDFISSDMHHQKHGEAFQKSISMPYVQNLLAGNFLKNASLY